MGYQRHFENLLLKRIDEPRRFMQVLLGPRQVGKTTIALSLYESFVGPKLFLSADSPELSRAQTLEEKWKGISAESQAAKRGLLVIDEIHKYPHWEKTVKARWDEDSRTKVPLKVIILGSAPLLIQRGLSESLAGRFEVTDVPHWSYSEVHQAFGVSLEEYIFFGGYPGAMSLRNDEERWRAYIKNSLIETTISRDIMLLTRIDKPALLRQLFFLACEYSSQVLSYQKMVGHLQDAGNTTTLAHYLELLSAVGFVKGLQKFSGSKVMSRASSPKLQVYNTALVSAFHTESFQQVKASPSKWGRWVESAVGSHLLNQAVGTDLKIQYWKEGAYEVDFVVTRGEKSVGLEVKSGGKREALPGLDRMREKHRLHRTHLIGRGGIELLDFFQMKITDLF